MTNSIFVVPAVLLWAAVLWRWPSRRQGTTQQALWLALVGIAITATLEIPAVEGAVKLVTPAEPNVAYLLKHVLVVGVAAAAREIVRGIALAPQQARRGVRRRSASAAAVVVALGTLFFAAPVDGDVLTPDFTDRYGREPAMLAFWTVFLGWLGAALVSTIRLTWRYGRQAPRSRLRTAILLIGGSATACLGYVAAKATYLVALGAQVEQRFTLVYTRATGALLLVSMLLIVAGCTWTQLGRLPGLRHLSAYRRLRRLLPLWQALYEATPAIALTPPIAGRVRAGIRDLEVRLYRCVIEIRDGALALRPYAAPDLRERGREAARNLGVPDRQIEPVAEAVWLEVARRAKLRGDPPVPEVAINGLGGIDLAGELEILEQISTAYQRSEAVRVLADRLDNGLARRVEGVR